MLLSRDLLCAMKAERSDAHRQVFEMQRLCVGTLRANTNRPAAPLSLLGQPWPLRRRRQQTESRFTLATHTVTNSQRICMCLVLRWNMAKHDFSTGEFNQVHKRPKSPPQKRQFVSTEGKLTRAEVARWREQEYSNPRQKADNGMQWLVCKVA